MKSLVWVGVVTCAIVGIPSVLWEVERGTLFTPRALVWLASFTTFVLLFFLTASAERHRKRELLLLAAQTVTALTCVYLQKSGFAPILLVMIAGELGGQTPKLGFTWIGLQTIAMLYVLHESGQRSGALVGMAYLGFQFFGYFAVRIAHQELEARQKLSEAHAELQVANSLLDISSRSEERLRIARDVHDLLGHHLTALSLNLEVASHLTEGKAKEQIETSKAIAKLLLSDIRDVVSRLRDEEPIDLAAALSTIQTRVQKPAIHVELANDAVVSDSTVARLTLRTVQEIVTNAIRHSGARNLWLGIKRDNGLLALDARDDGSGVDLLKVGNGLRGMRERVEEVNGTMRIVSRKGEGFNVEIRIPMETNP